MPKPTHCYLRVSTDSQDVAAQESVVRAWLAAHGVDPESVEWYRDAETGDTMARKDLKRLNRAIDRGEVKTLVVYKLDRISRKMLDGLNFVGHLVERGVRFVSVTQHVDVSGTMGRIVAAILFGFAEIEQETRRDRQKAGIALARQKGVYLGRQKGTTKGKPERVAELRAMGLTVAEIATAAGVTTRTVHRYLKQAGA